MNDLTKFGWVKILDIFDNIYGEKLRRCIFLMRLFKSKEMEDFTYVLIDRYFISNNNLYFTGNNEVYFIDLNNEFNYSKNDIDYCLEDYLKIKFLCNLNIENIIKYELISNQLKRDKRINELLKIDK